MTAYITDPMPNATTLSLYDMDRRKTLAVTRIGNIAGYDDRMRFRSLLGQLAAKAGLKEIPRPKFIAHRLIFGGEKFLDCPVVLNRTNMDGIADLTRFAPLHLSAALETIRIFQKHFKDTEHVAFFETSFFSGLPVEQKNYALPFSLTEKYGIRRYGFHGLFHGYAAGRFPEHRRVISLCMDRKITVCGILGGKPVSVAFGFTPLEGIMGERNSGDIDAGIMFYLMEKEGMSRSGLDRILKEKSGLYGLTGSKRSFAEAYGKCGTNLKYRRAFEILKYQIVSYIGRNFALVNGLDLLAVGGNCLSDLFPFVYGILKSLWFLGLDLKSPEAFVPGGDGMISTACSPVKACLIDRSFADIIGERLARAV